MPSPRSGALAGLLVLIMLLLLCSSTCGHRARHQPERGRQLDRLLQRAVRQIVLGELRQADVALLRALNYSDAAVAALRRRVKRPDRAGPDGSLEAFNRRAVYDYENAPLRGPDADYDDEAAAADEPTKYNGRAVFRLGHGEATTPIASATRSNAHRAQLQGEYEGLEWLGEDVYRVRPEALAAELRREADDEDGYGSNRARQAALDDSSELQGDGASEAADPRDLAAAHLQRVAAALRHDAGSNSTKDSQGQKAMEDIKRRILTLTGRFNASSPNDQVQREKLTMYSPICQIPRNADADAWADPFSMNLHFQLNLTSSAHVLAAKLRLFKLPQASSGVAANSSGVATTGAYEEAELEDDKKIRVSVYFYTKSLKKHRAKKRLMDSAVLAVSAQGSHLALDVRQALRFWKPNGQRNHLNHGLTVQVEDQDGKPLKPSLYIYQSTSCRRRVASDPDVDADADTDTNADEKAYQFIPALFVRACNRYVRVVNDQVEMYIKCSQTQKR